MMCDLKGMVGSFRESICPYKAPPKVFFRVCITFDPVDQERRGLPKVDHGCCQILASLPLGINDPLDYGHNLRERTPDCEISLKSVDI